MSIQSLANPFPLFTDKAGESLTGGAIYIGVPDLDPQTNPVTVYWDSGKTQPALQPIATDGGYPVTEGGLVTNVYIDGAYSITVRDEAGSLVFTDLYVGDAATDEKTLTIPQDFGATGDGVTDDTAAWSSFQAARGARFVPPGDYLVSGEVLSFDQGAYGNGKFDDSSGGGTYENGYWDQVWGDKEAETVFMQQNDIDVNALPLTYDQVSPVMKTQTKIAYDLADGGAASSFTRVVGAYHEAIGSGDYSMVTDTKTGNFTGLASTVHNKFAGQFGMTAITGRCWDAKESEVPNIDTLGASKSTPAFFSATRRAKVKNGAYMLGMETYSLNTSDDDYTAGEALLPDETAARNAGYFPNRDDFGYQDAGESWVVGYHCYAGSDSVPTTAGIFINGSSTAQHAFMNGILIGGSSMQCGGTNAGHPETVGINMSSWRADDADGLTGSYGHTGIRFRSANRHLWFREGAKVHSPNTRVMNPDGNCSMSIEADNLAVPSLKFMDQTDSTFSPTARELFAVIGGGDACVLRTQDPGSDGNEMQFWVENGVAIYKMTSARLAPATADDGNLSLGGATQRWADVWAVDGTINTSDERLKEQVSDIPDAWLDAWGDVDWQRYKWIERVAEKGAAARWHLGVIAQRVEEAFASRGLNAFDIGLLCYDEWDDEGDILDPETGEKIRDAAGAGNRYSMRYSEAFVIEAAYQRRRMAALEARVAALEP